LTKGSRELIPETRGSILERTISVIRKEDDVDGRARLSGNSRAVAAATVAAAGGCREEVVEDDKGDDWSSCCAGVARPVARLSDIWPQLCMLLSGGPARPLGVPQGRDPH